MMNAISKQVFDEVDLFDQMMYDETAAQYDNQIQTTHEQYEIQHEYLKSWLDKVFKGLMPLKVL
jgi:hypothetical protein